MALSAAQAFLSALARGAPEAVSPPFWRSPNVLILELAH
jgi:hypothetical protein